MSLTTDPPQPVSGADTTFRVTMTSQAGAPVDGTEVQADLKMRTMDMGRNVVKLADTGDGVYEGKGQFSMAGPWDVVVNARKDAETGTQAFPLVVKK
jgi:nitrogen fixation protein FixH